MTDYSAENVALEVDVWEVLEDFLDTGIVDVLRVSFVLEEGLATVEIKHPKDSRINTKVIKLDLDETFRIVSLLGSRFKFGWVNLSRLTFELNPGEVPAFQVRYCPFVDDPATLNKTKSRMNPMTVD